MKKFTLIIIMCFWGIHLSYSQSSVLDKKINIQLKNNTIKDVFSKISKQTNCFFTYNPEIINNQKIYNQNFQNKSVLEILDITLSDSTLTYKIIDDHIVICKKNYDSLFTKKMSETDSEWINISGKISDSKSNKAIPFVSVGILNTTIGTVCNESGEFSLNLDSEYLDSVLYVIHLGYKTLKIPVREAMFRKNNFKLKEDFISIQEIIIRTNDPYFLIKKALEYKHKNYFQTPTILTSFYREGANKKETVLNFSEALIKIYKTPYKLSFDSDKISLIKSRKIINTEKTDTLNLKLKDGLYSSLELDIVKLPIHFLEEINMSYYNYKTTDIVTYNDKLAYAIDFKQKENIENSLYKGRVYIETQSFAIIAAEFQLNLDEGNKKSDFVVKKNRKIKVTPISARYYVSYRPVGNKYILNHVRADLELKIKRKNELFSSKYKTFFESVVFDVDTLNNEKFEPKEIVKKNLVFIDSHYSYDPGFWGNDNFIKPEESIQDALKELQVKLDYLK